MAHSFACVFGSQAWLWTNWADPGKLMRDCVFVCVIVCAPLIYFLRARAKFRQSAITVQAILNEASEVPGGAMKKIKKACRKWLIAQEMSQVTLSSTLIICLCPTRTHVYRLQYTVHHHEPYSCTSRGRHHKPLNGQVNGAQPGGLAFCSRHCS